MKAALAAGALWLAAATVASAEVLTTPAVGVEAAREIGEALFSVEIATRVPGIRIPVGTEVPMGFGAKLIARLPTYPARKAGKAEYCGHFGLRNAMGMLQEAQYLCVTEKMLRKAGAPYEPTTVTEISQANLRQELLYQGKAGGALRLSYREYVGDLARPAFTQELSFDLAEGSIVGAKGARIEVLDATNTSIRYRVVQPFAPVTAP